MIHNAYPEKSPHLSVMPEESLAWLRIRPCGCYVDATAGAGGHSARILEQLNDKGRLIAIDRDLSAVEMVRARFAEHSNVQVAHANYRDLNRVLSSLGIESVDGVLIDAGVSSMQIDLPDRGFSFQEDGPLDMRMDPENSVSAAEWLRRADRDTIERTLKIYGDVKPAGRIARVIKDRCGSGRMERTRDLAEAVSEALPFVKGTPDELRTVFQAVRIAVNDELGGLEAGVQAAIEALHPEGRLVVISFHSGEDRVVKELFRNAARREPILRPDGRKVGVREALVRLLTDGPIGPTAEEQRKNPRAKSARLRAVERL